LAKLSPEARARGVIAFSSGNHAQAVALAGRELEIAAVIVMPRDAPAVKLEATRGYGAEVLLYDPKTQNRESIAKEIATSRGLTLIPPFDHADIIAGQGTAAKELIEETGPLDYLFVPCGGGGLISGSALAATTLSPGCKVIGVEPEAGDDATRSFKSGTLQTCSNPDTIADGARTASLGTLTFPMVLALVHDMITVNDAALLSAMRYLMERMKIVVEPTGVLGVAGLFEKSRQVAGMRVGVIISGGNVDLSLSGLFPG
jgi:threo-3-hydroxy-L-aspartate ammonia-lyase